MEQFIVSARKYRPQTFNDVVGQKSTTNTLPIESNHLASALLFTGPRGVGKQLALVFSKINQPGYDDPMKILLLMCLN
jgi:DNA polymerase-3 subunit gamma/tau